MSDPNVNASPKSVSDKLDGLKDGQPLTYDLIDQLQVAERFSLSGTVPDVTPVKYPEGENVSPSFIDHVNTLGKVFLRLYKAKDGNTYDAWDMLTLVTDYVLAQTKAS